MCGGLYLVGGTVRIVVALVFAIMALCLGLALGHGEKRVAPIRLYAVPRSNRL